MPLLIIIALLGTDATAEAARRRRSCENATIPTPRSASCHAWSPATLEQWSSFHKVLVSQAVTHTPQLNHPRLLMVGDSITEAFLGTAIGQRVVRTIGVERSLAETLALDYPSPAVLAISGDETQHLLWRLETELSPTLCEEPRLFITLLIGTNNLANADHSVDDTAAGVLSAAHTLLARTAGRLLVLALLPRGENPVKPRAKRGGRPPRTSRSCRAWRASTRSCSAPSPSSSRRASRGACAASIAARPSLVRRRLGRWTWR